MQLSRGRARFVALTNEAIAWKRASWENVIRERSQTIANVRKLFLPGATTSLADIRRAHATITGELEQLKWQMGQYLKINVSGDLVDLAEKHLVDLATLKTRLACLVAERDASSPRKTTVPSRTADSGPLSPD